MVKHGALHQDIWILGLLMTATDISKNNILKLLLKEVMLKLLFRQMILKKLWQSLKLIRHYSKRKRK